MQRDQFMHKDIKIDIFFRRFFGNNIVHPCSTIGQTTHTTCLIDSNPNMEDNTNWLSKDHKHLSSYDIKI